MHASVTILYHLTHSSHISHIGLEPAAPSGVSPSICHVHLEHQPCRQSHKHLCNAILQQALLHASIGQYRSHDHLPLLPRRVCIVSLLYPLLNISLSLKCGMTGPCSWQAPLRMVVLYLSMLWSWCDINFTLPYDLAFTILTLILL